MKIPSNALVFVADGRKALVLRNAGDDMFPNLKTEWVVVDQANPSTTAQGADRPGRVSHQGRRSSVEQTDWHTQEETAFAIRAAAGLEDLVRDLKTRQIIIVAPPRTLSVLRRNLGSDTSEKVIAELAQDLVNHSVSEIETHVGRAKIAS